MGHEGDKRSVVGFLCVLFYRMWERLGMLWASILCQTVLLSSGGESMVSMCLYVRHALQCLTFGKDTKIYCGIEEARKHVVSSW